MRRTLEGDREVTVEEDHRIEINVVARADQDQLKQCLQAVGQGRQHGMLI